MCKDIQQQTYVLQIFENRNILKTYLISPNFEKRRLICKMFCRGVPDVNLCDKVCHWCVAGLFVFSG